MSVWCVAVVRVFDAHTGRPVSTITHNLDVVEIALSQFSGDMNDRRLAFIDQNRDLYITPVLQEHPVSERLLQRLRLLGRGRRLMLLQRFVFGSQIKLHTMVECVAWNDSSDMLAALGDGQLLTWLYPSIVFVDKDLLECVP